MLIASYIRRHFVKFMEGLIILFDICCSLRFILRLWYKWNWYVTGSLDNPLHQVADTSSGAIKVISGTSSGAIKVIS